MSTKAMYGGKQWIINLYLNKSSIDNSTVINF